MMLTEMVFSNPSSRHSSYAKSISSKVLWECSTVLECSTVFPRGKSKHRLNSNTKHMITALSDNMAFKVFTMVKAKNNNTAPFRVDGLSPFGTLLHESKTAKYYKYPNGVVKKVYKVKDQTQSTTRKVTVSNDRDGEILIETLLKPLGIKRKLFRVPNDGQPYKAFGNFTRNGNIQKSRAKIIDVYLK